MQVPVNHPPLFRLQRERVLDQVADFVGFERSGRHRRGERKVRRIKLRELEAKIKRVDVAGAEGGQLEVLERGVGSRQVHAQMIADQKADDGHGDLGMGL